MKFINYLNEQPKSDEHVLAILEKDCKTFLDFCKKNKCFFRRNYSRFDTNMTIEKFVPRKDRRPKDTNPIIHNLVDNLFKQKFGWKVRSEGVFTYPEKHVSLAQYYFSSVGMFFAVGQFEVVYAKKDINRDLYVVLNREWDTFKFRQGNALISKLSLDSIEDIPEMTPYIENFSGVIKNLLSDYTDNKNLPEHIFTECVFKCSSYYLVDPQIIKNLVDKDKIQV